MIVAETRAYRVVHLESPLRRVKLYSRWLEWIVLREQQSAPVEPTLIRALLQAKDQEVPGVNVRFHG